MTDLLKFSKQNVTKTSSASTINTSLKQNVTDDISKQKNSNYSSENEDYSSLSDSEMRPAKVSLPRRMHARSNSSQANGISVEIHTSPSKILTPKRQMKIFEKAHKRFRQI